MQKIIVSGGAGFIGSTLVDELIRLGNDVVIIDDLSTGKKEYVNPKAKFYEADIRDKEKIAEIFASEKFDFVFHLAAQIDVRKSVEDPYLDNAVNAVGSLNIFEACKNNNVKKIIFISTGGALYGDCQEPATEETKVEPLSPYAIHKYAAERYLELFKNVHGLDYVILRLANIYGPRQFKGGEGAVAAVFTHDAITGKESIIYGDGTKTRDFVYAGDVVDACIKSMDSEFTGVLNIGSGIEISIKELAETIKEISKGEFKYRFEKDRPGEVWKSVLNPKKAKEVINWEPEISLGEGLKKTIEWVKNQ